MTQRGKPLSSVNNEGLAPELTNEWFLWSRIWLLLRIGLLLSSLTLLMDWLLSRELSVSL